jgi:hypothetical protein
MFRKKVFAVMATVLFVGSTMSMAPAVEEDGKASDCVRSSSSIVHSMADDVNQHPNDDLDFWLNIYMFLYESCLGNLETAGD